MDGAQYIEVLKKFLERKREIYKVKQGLLAHVGRTAVAQSNVEYNLLILFEMISQPLTDVESRAVYRKSGGFKQRLNMIDYAVRSRGTADEIEEWAGIKQALDSNTSVRNNSAHYNLSLSFDDDLNPLAASLVRPPFASFGKEGHTVVQRAIEEAGTALEKAAFNIGELTLMVADRLYPEEMVRHNASGGKD